MVSEHGTTAQLLAPDLPRHTDAGITAYDRAGTTQGW
jgi:hypothetical protein